MKKQTFLSPFGCPDFYDRFAPALASEVPNTKKVAFLQPFSGADKKPFG